MVTILEQVFTGALQKTGKLLLLFSHCMKVLGKVTQEVEA